MKSRDGVTAPLQRRMSVSQIRSLTYRETDAEGTEQLITFVSDGPP